MKLSPGSIRHLLIVLITVLLASCTEEKLSPDVTGSIRGRVLNETDLSPIENAEVSTDPPSHSVLTDSLGYFDLEDIQSVDYKVIAKQKDFFTSSTAIKVNPNTTTQVTIKMNKRISGENVPEFSASFHPAHQQSGVSVNTVFTWKLKQNADTVTYNLKLFESGNPVAMVIENIADTFAVVQGLKFSTTYLWQLSAQNSSATVFTDIRTFNTQAFPSEFLLYAKRINGVSQIFVTDSVAGYQIQLTHNNYHSWRPIANSKKDRIAFLSTKDLNPQLFTMNPDGSDVRRITNIATGGYYNKGVGFSWLPNGEQLIFSSYNNLYTINWNGSDLRQVASIEANRHFREVDWSPVNDKIVALTQGVDRYDTQIILMNVNGSDPEIIVSGGEGALENPSFSIDGRTILYTYDVSGFKSPTGRQLDARIFEFSLQTKLIRPMSAHKPDGTNDLQPRYTPNGAQVFFINTQNTPGARHDLWIMRSDSTTIKHRKLVIEDVEISSW